MHVDVKERKSSFKVPFVVQFILLTAGFSSLLKVSSEYLDGMVYIEDFSNYFVSYLLCYGLGIGALFYNHFKNNDANRDRHTRITICVFALLFALLITIANYALWYLPTPEYADHMFRNIYRLLYVFLVFAGAGCAAYNFFGCISDLFFLWKPGDFRVKKPVTVFLIVFVLISLTDLGVLILCKYPGNLQTDSFAQIYQATGDFDYSNHHPFYHTMLIKFFMNIGMMIFGNYNAAVALYNCFQVLFMAACFAYGVVFLYELRAPRWMLVLNTVIYAIAPYHIMYSFSITKDTMFAGFMLVSVVSLFRYMKDLGNRTADLIVTVISGLGVCLFRSNGLFVYVLWIVSIVCIVGRAVKEKEEIRKLLICMIMVGIVSFVMKHPVLKILGVSQTDLVESLSIPIQQIARTVADNDDLTEEQTGLISGILEVDKIRESYSHYSSDPLKERIRAEGNENHLVEHKADYLRLYIDIGIKHPGSYLSGWVDQTYGFWNAGFKDWHWYDWVDPGIYDNRYEIHRTVINEKLNNVFNEYLWIFEEVPVLQLFLCMGLHMWIVLAMLFIAIVRKDRHGIIIILPLIWILISLMIATPLSMEFRYFYAVFCVLPIIVTTVLRDEESNPGESII